MQPSFLDSFTFVDWVILGLKFAMWLLLCKIFILVEFGAVFFIFSAFLFIWYVYHHIFIYILIFLFLFYLFFFSFFNEGLATLYDQLQYCK